MSPPDWPEAIRAYQETLHAVVRGDPEPQKRLWSRSDGVTLANPLGPPVRGWGQVEQAIDHAISQLRDGDPVEFERSLSTPRRVSASYCGSSARVSGSVAPRSSRQAHSA
jgi:hypothetical protein